MGGGGPAEVRPTEFRMLGPLEVVVGGEPRPVPGEKLQTLLARLLIDRNRPVSAERLIDALWGDDPPANARQTLHAHIGRLRRLLGDGSLGNDGHGYVLRAADDRVDAAVFRHLVAAARADAARERYRAALALWRGEALEGVAPEVAGAERRELEELRLAALEERIDLDLAAGAAAEILPELHQLVQREPLRERAWAQLMTALYAGGRQAEALAAYQDARRALAQVGLEPGPALRELEHKILNQDPSLATAPLHADARHRPGVPHRALAAVLAVAAAAVVIGVFVAARDDPPAAAGPVAPVVRPNSLVELDPATNRVVSSTRVGHGPDSIASTGDAIWVANREDRTVARVDLATKRVRVVGGAPVAASLAGTLNGDVWLSSFEEPLVTQLAREGRVLDNRPHAIAAAPARVRLPGSAEALAVGGGYLWVTSPSDSGGKDTVFQIDLRTRKLVSSIPVGLLPLYAAFGYGSAWISNYKGDSVTVVRPGSEQPESIPVASGPLGIAAGDGAIWVVAFWSRELVRIDPDTRRVVARIPVGAGPQSVAVGDGAVWVTNRDDKTITRIDPATNSVTRTIHLAAAPYGIRVAHGRVWVTTQRCGSPVTTCAGRG